VCYRLHSSSHPFFLVVTLPRSLLPALFPYTTLFRSSPRVLLAVALVVPVDLRVIVRAGVGPRLRRGPLLGRGAGVGLGAARRGRSEEHTSELQSRFDIVCRLLLDKKKVQYLIDIGVV